MFSSTRAKVIFGIIIALIFLVPSASVMDEVQTRYEQEAYQQLVARYSQATEQPQPTAEAAATAEAAPTAGSETTSTNLVFVPIATVAPESTPAPTLARPAGPLLPMDTYEGGHAYSDSNFYNGTVTLGDGTVVNAEFYKDSTLEAYYYQRRYYDSDINFIILKLADPSLLRTAIASEVRGSSLCETAIMARAKKAVACISGEYYVNRETGVFIARQSQIIKSTPSSELHQLVIDTDGNFHMSDNYDDAARVVAQYKGRIYQAFCFGPILVNEGQAVHMSKYRFDAASENPRIAIGQMGELTYMFCAANGRNDENKGVTTNQLADIMADNGCIYGFNLDGGGSSTMYWHDKIVNQMNYSGNQREVSDCIYVATAQ